MADSLDSLSSFYIQDTPVIKEELGHGAYAVVKKIVVYETECAAKIIYEELVSQNSSIGYQYTKELRLQATLRHPNITQFLGVCELEESSLPVLVMELMHSNLHEFLSKSDMRNIIPLSRKKSILEDVARGLLYLHKKDIAHRDLTAKNVLLTSSLVAKIADLGTSRIVPKEVDTRANLTKYPGTVVYMPPEADRQDYDPKKLDVFSFGHLTLFTLIQVFPADLDASTFTEKSTSELKPRTEIERREKYFTQLEEKIPNGKRHPLTVMARQCLDNLSDNRPEVSSILHTLQTMDFKKEDYEDKGLNVLEAFTMLAQKKKGEVEDRYDLILQQKDAELEILRQRLGDIKNDDDPTSKPTTEADTHTKVEQEWQHPKFRMDHPKAVAIGDRVYMGGGYAAHKHVAKVLELEFQSGKWNEIENCPLKYFGMTVVKNQLFVVAGVSNGTKMGDVYTLDLDSKEWKLFPCAPINEKRSTPSVVTYADKWLIVIGGENSRGLLLDSIERLNTEEPHDQRHWVQSPKLPTKCAQVSSTIVGNDLYIFVTKETTATSMEMPSNRVYYAPLDVLVYSDETFDIIWQEIAHVPSKASTPLSYSGFLLALGGFETESIATCCIYKLEYHTTTDGRQAVWKKIDNLPQPLYQCAATQITDQIFVYGMCSDSKSSSIHVYLHTLN